MLSSILSKPHGHKLVGRSMLFCIAAILLLIQIKYHTIKVLQIYNASLTAHNIEPIKSNFKSEQTSSSCVYIYTHHLGALPIFSDPCML